jgi:recombination protein RecT
MTTEIAKKSETKTLKELLTGPEFADEVAKVSTKYLTPERMIRVAETSLNRIPELQNCKPESFFVALLNCSAAGIEPDGQHAYLIPFKRDCQLIISWKGLLAIARRNGVHCTTKVVCKNDVFEVIEDDGTGRTTLLHKVDYTKPRGDMYAVYSRATWSQDGFDYLDYEVMTKADCEKVRDNSQAGKSGPWKNWFDEMCRKTVIRRHSKRWPLTSEAHNAINSDDDAPDFEKRVKQAKPINAAKPIFNTPAELPEPDEIPMGESTKEAQEIIEKIAKKPKAEE